ncbi:ion transporter [Pelagicoccus sp. SDUM812002]|uniref:ion transporter n=1 Tax=Pelagicoccus sp. SDUM812002 TaxID=3041266 RepID=UPI00280F72D3|nr:ion transporter [Pelagicoccus sp. SDUM812002]MDQ8184357.1 ion transporter [Pelagicoccus sp. SDUM812002]
MSETEETPAHWSKFRESCRLIIFHSSRPAEKLFDVLLILAIITSVVTVMLASVESIRQDHGHLLYGMEWVFTGLFTLEYFVRIYVSKKPLRYVFSFFGIVDLLSILPTYVDLIFPGAHYLMLFRALRVLRIFRVLKMVQFVGEANQLYAAVRASARKIIVFVMAVVTLVLILGSIMYLIEGPENGFTSIPKSVYWAIVTLTTVGYGDISPQTPLGQMFASFIMITGYGVIAVPTGIVTAELTMATTSEKNDRLCQNCGETGHKFAAKYCRNCGERL